MNSDLTGASLAGITSRFQQSLAERLTEVDIGEDWVEIPDLYDFMRVVVMEAALVSMFGPYILSLNPTFIHDFWAWNEDMGALFLGLPRWIIPKAYRRRAKMLENIKRWHKHAHEHFDCTRERKDDPDWEPYFGSKFSRRRQAMFGRYVKFADTVADRSKTCWRFDVHDADQKNRWEEIDATAKAADDLGFIWA